MINVTIRSAQEREQFARVIHLALTNPNGGASIAIPAANFLAQAMQPLPEENPKPAPHPKANGITPPADSDAIFEDAGSEPH